MTSLQFYQTDRMERYEISDLGTFLRGVDRFCLVSRRYRVDRALELI